MKSTKIKIMSLLLVVVMVLTGCINEDVSVKINKDGSGTVTVVADIEKEALLDMYVMMSKESFGYEMPKSMLEASIESQMKEQGFELVTKDGVEYYTQTQTQKCSNEELNGQFSDQDGVMTSWITGDTFYVEMNTKETLNSLSGQSMMGSTDTSEYEDLIKEYAEKMIIRFNSEFTAPIVSVNSCGKIDEENPNKAVFEFDGTYSEPTMVMFATTNPNVTVATCKAAIKKANTVSKSKVKLKAPKLSKKAKKAKKATLKYTLKKVKGVKGYEVEYSLKKSMKNSTVITTKKTKGTIKNLKTGKKYYVRVRCFKTNYAGLTVYSKWSSKKAIKTKKAKKSK